jgi:transcriptional regulator with XRE-family HTH domain
MVTAGPDGGEDGPADATVLRMLLGAQLRRFREAAGVTPEAAGYEIRASASKISRLEKGKVRLKARDVVDLLALYGVTDETVQAEFLALAGRSGEPDWWARYRDVMPGWFETYIGLEAAASAIRSFEVQFVPGLFQTEDYARAVTIPPQPPRRPALADDAERRVALRLKRQDLLSRPDAPWVWSVVDEAVLHRTAGGRAVMRAQFRRLIELAALERVTIQVVPFASGIQAAESGSFAILRFAEPDVPDVVYTEQLTGARYLDQRQDVEQYLQVASELSRQALTPAATIGFIEQAARDL